TLQTREIDEPRRHEFYRIMLEDSERLLHTIEQVLQAGAAGSRFRRAAGTTVDLGQITRECVELARTRFHLDAESLAYEQRTDGGPPIVRGDPAELKTAVLNLIDNAVKYSAENVRVDVLLEALDDNRLAIRVRDRGVGISP